MKKIIDAGPIIEFAKEQETATFAKPPEISSDDKQERERWNFVRMILELAPEIDIQEFMEEVR